MCVNVDTINQLAEQEQVAISFNIPAIIEYMSFIQMATEECSCEKFSVHTSERWQRYVFVNISLFFQMMTGIFLWTFHASKWWQRNILVNISPFMLPNGDRGMFLWTFLYSYRYFQMVIEECFCENSTPQFIPTFKSIITAAALLWQQINEEPPNPCQDVPESILP